MSVTLTLTSAEEAMYKAQKLADETVEQTFHRLNVPALEKFSETRLQTLANTYRALSADDQLEALALLGQWYAQKFPVKNG